MWIVIKKNGYQVKTMNELQERSMQYIYQPSTRWIWSKQS